MPARSLPRVLALSTAAVLTSWSVAAAPALAEKGGTGNGDAASSAGKGNGARAGKAKPAKGAQTSAGARGKSADRAEAAGGAGKFEDRGNGPRGSQQPAAPADPQPEEAPADGGGADGNDPAGNNGTVKIAPLGEADGIPQNTAHPGCELQVEWYGFDEGSDVVSTVDFDLQAPTTDGTLAVDGDTSVFVGGDPATGAGTATGLDGVETYTLSFDGTPHEQQGLHVKLTVATPYSQGNDTKSKVFWIEPCEAAPASAAGAPTESGAVSGLGQPGAADAADAGEIEALGAQGVLGTTAGADQPAGALGAELSGQSGVLGTQAAAGDDDADAAVPTAVDAGRSTGLTDLFGGPGGLALLGAALAMAAGAGLVARRRARA